MKFQSCGEIESNRRFEFVGLVNSYLVNENKFEFNAEISVKCAKEEDTALSEKLYELRKKDVFHRSNLHISWVCLDKQCQSGN